MRHNLAFIVKELKNDSFSTSVIKTVDEFIRNRPLDNICVFTGSCESLNTAMVPVLHISHASYFDSKVIALDFESLIFSSVFIQKKDIVYYATKTPWSDKIYKYSELSKLFDQNNISQIICPNDKIAKHYQKFFKQNTSVINDLTYSELYEKIQ
jgi:hypothetical protein